ncbi:MAG: TonB-dependent receptor [Bacteroidota bacterium]
MLVIPASLIAQMDTVEIEARKLGIQDIIKPVEDDRGKIKIISGSRFPMAAGELPFSVHVITKEEIRENSYETLVDALKMTPGIFTSQPGSAIEGETFMMRGLLGNAYTKILINDIPIKPAFVASMPIGAQLPIREAEQIEIIYGAGASLYGADASAGVINIITRQSDKPIYMQADLAIGGGEFSSANVMFGGKWGRDKNLLHYFAYGSNVIYEDRPIPRDFEENFNPESYPWLTRGQTFYQNLDNYRMEPDGTPIVNNTPHLSRKFGVNFKFRRISLSLESMTRRDHSSLGLNPVAVSYNNPLTFTGETIQRINLNFFKEKKNMNRKTDFTLIRYRMDDNSSIAYVQPQIGIELYNLAGVQARIDDPTQVPELRQEKYLQHNSKFLSGLRFMYGTSSEYRIEHVRNYRILKLSSLTLGGNIKYASGVPPTMFLTRPPDDDCTGFFIGFPCDNFLNDTNVFPVAGSNQESLESNLFGQFLLSTDKFNIVAGFNFASFFAGDIEDVDGGDFADVFLPRLAGLYKITDGLNIRTSWGRSYQAPNPFYNSSTYLVSATQTNELTRSPFDRLEAETTTSWESGIRFLTGQEIDFDFTYFINETENLISYGRQPFIEDLLNYEVGLGYGNAIGSEIKNRGGQFTTTVGLGNKTDGIVTYSWTRASLTNTGFEENNFLPQYNGNMWQCRFVYSPFKTTKIIVDYRRVKTGAVDGPNFNSGEVKFATVDMTGRYAFNDRLNCYFKMTNLFDKQYPGIQATRTPDDLIANTQYGFFIRVGMHYYIE